MGAVRILKCQQHRKEPVVTSMRVYHVHLMGMKMEVSLTRPSSPNLIPTATRIVVWLLATSSSYSSIHCPSTHSTGALAISLIPTHWLLLLAIWELERLGTRLLAIMLEQLILIGWLILFTEKLLFEGGICSTRK